MAFPEREAHQRGWCSGALVHGELLQGSGRGRLSPVVLITASGQRDREPALALAGGICPQRKFPGPFGTVFPMGAAHGLVSVRRLGVGVRAGGVGQKGKPKPKPRLKGVGQAGSAAGAGFVSRPAGCAGSPAAARLLASSGPR